MKKIKNYLNRLNDRSLNYGEKIISNWLETLDAESILDIGAGQGRDLLIAKNKLKNANLNAIENFPDSIESLERKDIKVTSLDLEKDKFPFEDKSLDLIIGNQILEHCKEIFWIHHEIFRTLKIGGSLIIGVPNLAAYYNRLGLLFGKQPYCISLDGAHVRGFTKTGYINFLNSAISNNYSLKDFKGANFVPFPKSFAILMSKLFPNSSTCIFFHIVKTSHYDKSFIEITKNLETPFWKGV